MELETARRLIAALNAVVALLEGSDDSSGLLQTLENTVNELNLAVDSAAVKISEKIIERDIADDLVKRLENEISPAIKQLAEDISVSVSEIQLDSALVKLKEQQEQIVAQTVTKTLKELNQNKSVGGAKTYDSLKLRTKVYEVLLVILSAVSIFLSWPA